MSYQKKEDQFTQFARVRDTGLRVATIPNDYGTELLTDENSKLWVRIGGPVAPIGACVPGSDYNGEASLQIGGVSYEEAPPAVDDSECNVVYMDLVGRVQVNHELLHAGEDIVNNVEATVIEPLAIEQHSLSAGALLAANTSSIIKGNPGRAYLLQVANESGGPLFLQMFNLIAAPGAGATPPVPSIRVPSSGVYFYDWSAFGRYFDTGIVIASSSTYATFTASAGLWAELLYR